MNSPYHNNPSGRCIAVAAGKTVRRVLLLQLPSAAPKYYYVSDRDVVRNMTIYMT